MRYGLPSVDKIDIIEWRPSTSSRVLGHPELGNIVNPTQEHYLEAGWYLQLEVVLSEYQRLETPFIFDEVNKTVSYTVNDWSQEEIDADLEQKAQQVILDLKRNSVYIEALIGKDNTWIDNKIDTNTSGANNAEIVENMRTTFKEIVYTQRDVADILTALYKLGRI